MPIGIIGFLQIIQIQHDNGKRHPGDTRLPEFVNALIESDAVGRLDVYKRQIPIIAMTANAFQEDEEEARKIGMDGYLVKPLEVDAIFRELRHYV